MSESAPIQGEICKTYGPTATEYLVDDDGFLDMRELASIQSLIRNIEEWFVDNKRLGRKEFEYMKENNKWV